MPQLNSMGFKNRFHVSEVINTVIFLCIYKTQTVILLITKDLRLYTLGYETLIKGNYSIQNILYKTS